MVHYGGAAAIRNYFFLAGHSQSCSGKIIAEHRTIELLPVIQYKKRNAINIASTSGRIMRKHSWQLEWKNKLALTVPSAVIYKASHKHSQSAIGGRLPQEPVV